MTPRQQYLERVRVIKKLRREAQAAAVRTRINGRIKTALQKADTLCSSGCREVVNICQIVRGYIELYDYYEPGTFPWQKIWQQLRKVERRIGQRIEIQTIAK